MNTIQTWRRVSVALLVIILVQDPFTHHATLKNSTEWSLWLQKSTPAWVSTVADPFNTVGVYWVPVFMFFQLAYTKNRPYWLHLFTILALPYGITAIVKALYYRGRPFVIDPQVQGCTCNPGMPSNHAVLALSSYYVAQKLLMDNLFQTAGLTRTLMAILLTTVNVVICFLICASRVILGVHSHIQILTGVMICATCFLYLREQDFKWFLNHLLPQLKPIFGLAMFLHALFIPVMIYINYYYRSDPWWKYWSKCEVCGQSWVPGMCESLGIVFGFFAVFYFLPTKVTFRLEVAAPKYEPLEKSPSSVKWQSEERIPIWVFIQRMLLLLMLVLPAILGMVVGIVWVKPMTLQWGIPFQGLFATVFYGVTTLYTGQALINLSVEIWHWWGVASEYDVVDLDHLEKDFPSSHEPRLFQSHQDWDARSGKKREEFHHQGHIPTNKIQELTSHE